MISLQISCTSKFKPYNGAQFMNDQTKLKLQKKKMQIHDSKKMYKLHHEKTLTNVYGKMPEILELGSTNTIIYLVKKGIDDLFVLASV